MKQQIEESTEYFLPSTIGFKFNFQEAQENYAEILIQELEDQK